MSEINLKLKTYDELTFEISRLNTDKYLLEQKLQQKENIIKEVREYIETEYVQVKNKEYNLSWNNLEYIIKEIVEILDRGSDEISK